MRSENLQAPAWNPHEDAGLAFGAGLGMMASHIARALGRTRGSVIGRARRTDIILDGYQMRLQRVASHKKRIRVSKDGHKRRRKTYRVPLQGELRVLVDEFAERTKTKPEIVIAEAMRAWFGNV